MIQIAGGMNKFSNVLSKLMARKTGLFKVFENVKTRRNAFAGASFYLQQNIVCYEFSFKSVSLVDMHRSRAR